MESAGFKEVVQELKEAVVEASANSQVDDADLRDILAFLTKVVQVVDQSFQDVYTLAVELAYLREEDLSSERFRRLRMELELLMASSHYRESLEICSRLKHLKTRFNDYIRPAISQLPGEASWQQLFWLIEDREGRVIRLVENTARELRDALERIEGGDLRRVCDSARKLADDLRPLLSELRELTNQILGLSGRVGFLELTRNRSKLGRAVSMIINAGGIHMARDVYTVDKAGAVGPKATAINTTFIEGAGDALGGVDLVTLVAQLAELRSAMQLGAAGSAEYAALAAISEAEDAAKQNDKPTVVAKLKAAGQWAFDTATKIGVTVAAKAIETSMGLG